ncbi:MAG: toprim domain-containing protein [Candidatus Campbellbacteria bacterium]|nr:toprim domain-containing protein [Candidatus Campbellbacteria bacterium]
MINDERFLRLKKFFTSFSGIGERQAKRFVYELLRMDDKNIKEVSEAMNSIVRDIKKCEECGLFCNHSVNKKCNICGDKTRDGKIVMVVEKDSDVYAIESSQEYKGKYIVLGRLIPMTNSQEDSGALSYFHNTIKKMVNEGLGEVVLAFSATPNGDHTTDIIQNSVSKQFPKIKITVLGRGLSSGSELEYSDANTILHAIKSRNSLNKKN